MRVHDQLVLLAVRSVTPIVEGIPVLASSPHGAELTAWETVAAFVKKASGEARDTATRITSIDIHDREEALLKTHV